MTTMSPTPSSLAESAMPVVPTDLRTSADWQEELSARLPGTVVMDPDGWDRSNWQFSFHEEKITWGQFLGRVQRSTVIMSDPQGLMAEIFAAA